MRTITVSVPDWVYASLQAEANEDGDTVEQWVVDALTGMSQANIMNRAGLIDERIDALGLTQEEFDRLNDYLMAIMGLEGEDDNVV